MFLKPKSAMHKTQGLLYRRYTDLAESFNTNEVVKTSDDKYWVFDADIHEFVEVVPTKKFTIVIDDESKFGDGKRIYKYNGSKWVVEEANTLKNLHFGNIAKYQTNKYYYAGSFSFAVKGSIEGSETQPVKGNIVPLVSFTIKYYDDDINLDHDDLVVIGDHLFSVENPVWNMKLQPKPYKIYFATLNSIK